MKRISVLALILLPAVCLVACSGSPEANTESEPSLPATLPNVDMATFSLPLDQFMPSKEQSQSLYNARNILATRCMQRFGYTITLPIATDQNDTPGGRYERRYLLASSARAEVYGYKWPEITNQARPEEPELDLTGQSILSGKGSNQVGGANVPEGGCMGEASKALGIDLNRNSVQSLAIQLTGDSYERTANDSRVKAANARWSECMERDGYHYSDPGRANDDPTFATGVASPAEVATALADVKCKKDSNFISIMAAVETAYQRRAIEKHQQQLQAALSQLKEQTRIASEVIAGHK